MVHIDGAGGYVPRYRIDRSEVAAQHGGSASGQSALPARDETLVTMASEAASTALDRTDDPALDAVFSASVTDPFAEHGLAAQVAYRHGLEGDVRTGDFRASPRAATDALDAARRVVQATDGRALVVAADSMPVERGHDDEAYSGAAAGAVVLAADSDDPLADIHGVGAGTTGAVERHRLHGEPAEHGDRRFEGEVVFAEAAEGATTRALETAPDFPSHVVVGVPDQRMARGAIAEFPGEPEQVSTFADVGYAGAATFLLDLVHLLETAGADRTALGLSYGAGGADAVALTTRAAAADLSDGRTVADHIASGETVTYADHLKYRERPDYRGVVLQ